MTTNNPSEDRVRARRAIWHRFFYPQSGDFMQNGSLSTSVTLPLADALRILTPAPRSLEAPGSGGGVS